MERRNAQNAGFKESDKVNRVAPNYTVYPVGTTVTVTAGSHKTEIGTIVNVDKRLEVVEYDILTLDGHTHHVRGEFCREIPDPNDILKDLLR